jgi:hypothetical protein
MHMTKQKFVEAFTRTMKGELSSAEFARQAIDYMKSPDYNRWKAAHEAENLRAQREGREHLMALINQEKKAGTLIDYETVNLRGGHDSVCVLIRGQRTVCFPSYFRKESVDMNWSDVMDAKKEKACGNPDCGASTSIDDETLTFGSGNLSSMGFWQFPCVECAEDFKKAKPQYKVWPVRDAAQ